jgi:hypothetical protein
METLRTQGYSFTSNGIKWPLSPETPSLLQRSDIVLLDVRTESADVLKTLEELCAAIGVCSVRPRVLCYSTAHRNSEFVLAVKKFGARYVRVNGPEMLLEAIELLLTEMAHLEGKGPCFQIVHRFSQGSCAPGEEITAIHLVHDGNVFQLPLALAQRFVFDFLAQHRRIALDSLQIVSGLSADWFYRDHAANSGHRQVKKVRWPTVKVLVQRIRDAMAATFTQAQVRFNPADVLRSRPAEGSKRVLYQFHADVHWRHVPLH